MGSDFYEEDCGKKSFCEHVWVQSTKSERDEKNHRNIYHRKCKKCKRKQIGYDWISCYQHGINWFDDGEPKQEKVTVPNCSECNTKCNINEDGWYCPKCKTLRILKSFRFTEEEIKLIMNQYESEEKRR